MESPALTFAALERQIEDLPQHASHQTAPRRARWGNGIGIGAGLLGVILGKTFPGSHVTFFAVIVLFVIEITAFVLAWTAELPSLNLQPSRERRAFADVLDFDLPHHEKLICWLRGFPRERLAVMSSFASHRLERFRSKLPLLMGGMDKLGVLPLAMALFVQFRDMQWPPHLGWPEIVLFALLMLIYWLSILQLSLRFRLELYDTLLKKALAA